jgi:anthranilate synthase component 1
MFSNWCQKVTQGFKGDEFNVYRALRSINSPYLFSFDYGDFKIFGSSEAQIIVKTESRNSPIAGTFKRTGDDEKTPFLQKTTIRRQKKRK